MPIYEYKCQECEYYFEALQRIGEKLLTDCPQCNAKKLKRLVSAPNFRLKGKGWYETDFKKDNRKNLADKKEDKTLDKDKKINDKAPKKDTEKKKNKEDHKSKDIK